jgi:hypothetical protein
MKKPITFKEALSFRPSYRAVFRFGWISCLLLIIYSLLTLFITAVLGPPPQTAEGIFNMLSGSRFFGLLRLDILTVFMMPLYYVLFYCIYAALRENSREAVFLPTLLVFAGLTMFLAAPSAFSYLDLSDKYQMAADSVQKARFVSAGEAIIASDLWHGTGAKIGGILIQAGAVAVSAIMLKSKVFNKPVAYVGIAVHGLDLLHIVIGLFAASAGSVLMAAAGTLYLVWFPLLGFRFYSLDKYCREQES